MKKNAILFCLLCLIGTSTALAQSVVCKTPNTVCDTTIVRHWRGSEYIVYTAHSSGTRTVAYHNHATGNIISAPVPSYVTINDFRIANDSVFAGGSVNTGIKRGLLACFAINDLLAGNFYYHSLVWYPDSTHIVLGITQIEDVTRLALYRYGAGTRIAYIAYNTTNPIDPAAPYPYRVGFGDAAFVNGTSWDICHYHLNKDGIEEYTDICATENKIVIAARTNDSNRVKFQVFKKVRDYTNLSPIIYSNRYGCYDHQTLGKVMVAPLAGNLVSLAYHYYDTISKGLAIKTIDVSGSTPVIVASIKSPETATNTWHMNDMRYDSYTDHLLILNYIDDPFMAAQSYVFQIGAPATLVGPYSVRHCPYPKVLHALDNCTPMGFIASGTDANPNLNVWKGVPNQPGNCEMEHAVGFSNTTPTLDTKLKRHHCTYPPGFYYYYTPETATPKATYIICQ